MGCTRDIINAELKNKECREDFIAFFEEYLKEEFYFKKEWQERFYEFRGKENEKQWFYVDCEPLFRRANGNELIELLAIEFAKKYPENDFYISYYCTFSNCGDVIDMDFYYVSNKNEITIKETYGDDNAINYCEECDAEFDEPLVYLEDYDDNETYTCPECGAELTMYVSRASRKICLTE